MSGFGATIPRAARSKHKNIKQKQHCNKFNKDLGASLTAHLVMSPLAMQETPVQFLAWEDLLEKG